MRILKKDQLDSLFVRLKGGGRTLVGPTVSGHAVVFDEIDGVDDLPTGWTDAQGPGTYRLTRSGDSMFASYVVGPDSLKQHLLPAREVLYRAERRADGKVGFAPLEVSRAPVAYLGVRACDLAAARVQDRVFVEGGAFEEPRYRARRGGLLTVAVNCTQPGELCFCASTDTGPRVRPNRDESGQADLVITEREQDFLVEAGTPAGVALLDGLDTEPATDADLAWLDTTMEAAAQKMGRAIETEGLPERLLGRLDHPRWKEVAERCLACGNCTAVCPTCFCTTTETPSDLEGNEAQKVRLWESCFSEDHAYMHGGTSRPKVEDRYRQWLTHKVGSWVSQFGTSGCVGCGRCIAWCPVGIDLTEEIAALEVGQGRVSLPVTTPADVRPDDDLTPHAAEVVAVTRESADVVTLHITTEGADAFLPGQFSQLSLPGNREVPISISGRDGPTLAHTIRAVGAATEALCKLEKGQTIGIRGPYGRPWPLDRLAGGPVTVIAGGIGLAPLRHALREMLRQPDRFPEVRLVYGARTPSDALYVEEMLGWIEDPAFQLHFTVDRATPAWRGHVGVVTRLLDRATVPEGASALICGPEVMMRFTVEELHKLGIEDSKIFVTMERHMECATGFCGRCQLGPYFVCKDGPVFSFDQVRFLFGKSGF